MSSYNKTLNIHNRQEYKICRGDRTIGTVVLDRNGTIEDYYETVEVKYEARGIEALDQLIETLLEVRSLMREESE